MGAGVMGRWHASAARHAGADVVAVVDKDDAAARRLAARCRGAAVYDDLETCLAETPVDVVHVCTPVRAHAEQVVAALGAGAHVLAEKPLTLTPAETTACLELARNAGLQLAPVHQFPFQRGVERLLDARSELGDLVRVSYRTSSAGGVGWDAAARRRLLAEIVPHAASLFCRFAPGFDPRALALSTGDEDLAATGACGPIQLEAFITLRGRPPRNELEVIGTRASSFADLFHGFSVVDRGSAGGRGKATRPLRLGAATALGAASNGALRIARREPAYPGLRELVRAFYAACRGRAPAPISEAEILAAAELAQRAGLDV